MSLMGEFFQIVGEIKTINDAKCYFDWSSCWEAAIYGKEDDLNEFGWAQGIIEKAYSPLTILYEVQAVMQAIVKHHKSSVEELLGKHNVPPVSEGGYYMGVTSSGADVDSMTLVQLEGKKDDDDYYGSEDTSTRYDIHEINKFFREILKDVELAIDFKERVRRHWWSDELPT